MLAVCGGYQLLGRYYRTAEGEELPGVGLFGALDGAPGAGRRSGSSATLSWSGGAGTLVGFENHGGRTYLERGRGAAGAGGQPASATTVADGGEGAVSGNAFGTYLHGSLLPKNPRFADHLIETALRRRHEGFELAPLDDRVEEAAHAAAVRLATRRGIISV